MTFDDSFGPELQDVTALGNFFSRDEDLVRKDGLMSLKLLPYGRHLLLLRKVRNVGIRPKWQSSPDWWLVPLGKVIPC